MGVGPQAHVHAGVVLLGSGDQQLVEVGTIRARPHLSRGQDHKAVLSELWVKPNTKVM